MNTQPFPSLLLEALAERVLEAFPVDVWRDLISDPAGARLRLEQVRLTVLVALADHVGGEHIRGVVHHHGGWTDTVNERLAVAAFSDPQEALAAAFQLQRSVRGVHIGLVAADCHVARFKARGERILLLFGEPLQAAKAIAQRAVAGTIQLSPETFDAIAAQIEANGEGAVISAEVGEDDLPLEFSITLPPSRQAELSTFAGLGLC